jgi:hypothetical protein
MPWRRKRGVDTNMSYYGLPRGRQTTSVGRRGKRDRFTRVDNKLLTKLFSDSRTARTSTDFFSFFSIRKQS